MNYIVEVSDRADEDAQVIYDWIAERSPAGALRWYEAYQAAVVRLEIDAERHPLAAESNWFPREVRQILFKTRKGLRYRILYTISGSKVDVLHVRGPGQDLIQP
jgi:plasmid stabilization system protein ParE